MSSKFLDLFTNIDEYKQVNRMKILFFQKKKKFFYLDNMFESYWCYSNIKSISQWKFRSINDDKFLSGKNEFIEWTNFKSNLSN
jgi:hypothetical protein